MNVRKPDKAGTWYAAEPGALREEVEDCRARGAELYGKAEVLPGAKPAAAVVPHAGLFFSGPVAAVAFELLREAWERVDTFVVFGACHRMRLREPGIWAEGGWRTPLGDIAESSWNSPSILRSGRFSPAMRTASRTFSTKGCSVLPSVEKESMAQRGSHPTSPLTVSQAAMAIPASSSASGFTHTALSPKASREPSEPS